MSLFRSFFAVAAASAAVVSAGCEGCGEPPPQQQGRATLVAAFPDGLTLQSDGASTLTVDLTAKNADGQPDTSPVTVNVTEGLLVGGTTELSAQPDANGKLSVEFQCLRNSEATVTLTANNGEADTTATLRCVQPVGNISIDIDDDTDPACGSLQADGQTLCEIGLTVTQEANAVIIPQQGTVTVTVLSATPVDPLEAADTAVLQRIDATGPVGTIESEISFATDAEGTASFGIVAPTVAETIVLNVVFGVTGVEYTIEVAPFLNLARVDFGGISALNVTGGSPANVDVFVTNAAGAPDANGILDEITVDPDDATVSAGGATGVTIEDIALDAAGSVNVTVNTPVVNEVTEYTLTFTYRAVDFQDPIVATLIVQANPEGALLLNLTADPPFLQSDGAGAERQTSVDIAFTENNQEVGGGDVTLSIPNDSQAQIFFSDDPAATSIVLTDADFDANGRVSVDVEVFGGTPPGIARLIAVGTDNVDPNNDVTEELLLEVRREPILQAVVFVSVTPTGPIGIPGGSLPPSATVVFRVTDDRGQVMPNINVSFEANDTADPAITIGPPANSDAQGLVSTTVSPGTIPGPVTVVARAVAGQIVRTAQSTPIPIAGGLPSFETSSLECGANGRVAVAEPYEIDCTATLSDRFSNVVNGQIVQFSAEAGSEAVAVATAGVAVVSIRSTEEVDPPTDLLGWSYGLVLPLSPGDLVGQNFNITDANACFDSNTATFCDIIKLCADPDPVGAAFCPLVPGCLADVQTAAAVIADPPTPLEFAINQADRNTVFNYLDIHRNCGFPASCYTQQKGGLALGVADGDECPAATGCFDFTTLTDCPQDGLRTIMATSRGSEAFSDLNGNGFFDFDDVNNNGIHDETEAILENTNDPGNPFDDLAAMVDLPEPFLDRNDNCFRDDLTEATRMDSQPILKVVNTDHFADVDGNDLFGFNTLSGLDELNHAWDADTTIFMSERILEIEDFVLEIGELCTNPGQQHVCQTGASALCQERTGAIRDLDGDGDRDQADTSFAACAIPTLSALRETHQVAFRWFDTNGNCPSPDFAATSAVEGDGPFTVNGDETIALDAGFCGFGEEFNPLLPWCTAMPELGAPVMAVTLTRDCGDEQDPVASSVTINLEETTFSFGFTTICP